MSNLIKIDRCSLPDGILFVLTQRDDQVVHSIEPHGVASIDLADWPVGAIHQSLGAKGFKHGIEVGAQ